MVGRGDAVFVVSEIGPGGDSGDSGGGGGGSVSGNKDGAGDGCYDNGDIYP